LLKYIYLFKFYDDLKYYYLKKYKIIYQIKLYGIIGVGLMIKNMCFPFEDKWLRG
jgi:hypothetical protein